MFGLRMQARPKKLFGKQALHGNWENDTHGSVSGADDPEESLSMELMLAAG